MAVKGMLPLAVVGSIAIAASTVGLVAVTKYPRFVDFDLLVFLVAFARK